ncbi:MAG TPA: methyltransferase [Bacteroidia bacterium]|nr:methyltransferase [Bacteroidia bacterium]
MKRLLKRTASFFWRPVVARYLRKERRFRFENFELTVPPGVFHPGFFFSTKELVRYLRPLDLRGKKFLETGCGSGLVSIAAAAQKAEVTAVDISISAVECTKKNFERNRQKAIIFHSDLFASVPPGTFDIIAVNPPYYKKKALREEDHAWNCGEHMEYFLRFFSEAKRFASAETQLVMVLSDESDNDAICSIAAKEGWRPSSVQRKGNLFGETLVFVFTKQG